MFKNIAYTGCNGADCTAYVDNVGITGIACINGYNQTGSGMSTVCTPGTQQLLLL